MTNRDIERIAPSSMLPHVDEPAACPQIRDRVDDELSGWVASHKEEVRNLVCGSTLYRDAVFCGT